MKGIRKSSRTVTIILLAAVVLMAVSAPANAVYNAMQGRFLQPDPIGGKNVTGIVYFDPVTLAPMIDMPCKDCTKEYDNGMNVYEGIASNPVNYIDPFGRDWLDDEGINTDSQTWGGATAQVSIVSGQLFSLANLGTALANSFLALTGGSGRSALDKISDCVQAGDPMAHLDKVWEAAGKLGPLPFVPLPKSWMYAGDELALAKATGTPGLLSTRFAWGGMKMGVISPQTFRTLKFAGRAASKVATPITIAHGLYLAGLEAYCGVKHGILGY